MPYYFDVDGLGREKLYHSCHKGDRQLCPLLGDVERSGYYEDGYFRGMQKGRYSKFLDRLADTNFIRCKACGEEHRW